MAQIDYKNKRIIWDKDDFLAGINYQSSNGQAGTGARKGLENGNTSNFDPFRIPGYATPGYLVGSSTNSSTVTGALQQAVVYSSNAYAIGSDAKIHQITSLTSGGTVTNTGSFPHTITSGTGGLDCVTYKSSTTSYLFYSYKTSAKWDVGRYDFASTFIDDYMTAGAGVINPLGGSSTVETDGKDAPHPLIVGKDDILYMGDRHFVHAYDGSNTTVSEGVLTLPFGLHITSFVKYKDFLVIFAYDSTTGSTSLRGQAFAFFWDYLSQDPTYIFDLNANYVIAGFNYNGTIGCFVRGVEDKNLDTDFEIKLYDPSIGEFNRLTPVGDIPINGGVEVRGTDIYWNASGKVFHFSGQRGIVNHITSGTGSTSGILRAFSSANIINLSSGANLDKYSDAFAASAVAQIEAVSPVFSDGKTGHIRAVEVYLQKPVTSNTRSLSLTLEDFNANTAEVLSAITSFPSEKVRRQYDTSGAQFMQFSGLTPTLTWSTGSGTTFTNCPAVERIIVDYDEVNISTDN